MLTGLFAGLVGVTTMPAVASAASGTLPSVSGVPSEVGSGGNLTAVWSDIPKPNARDFVGLYPSAAAGISDDLAYGSTGGVAAGRVGLLVPTSAPPGNTYQLRLYVYGGSSTYYVYAPITVTSCNSACTLSEAPNPAFPGGHLSATWAGIRSPSSTDWIGVYHSSVAADSDHVASATIGATAAGTVTLYLPSNAPVERGYELRLFVNGLRSATSPNFQVQASPCPACTLSGSPNPVTAGSDLTVKWSGAPADSNLIGLFSSADSPDSAPWAYGHTGGAATGQLDMAVPKSAPAGNTWELRLERGSYSPQVVSASFTMKASCGNCALSEGPDPAIVGSRLLATWANVPPDATAWIGVFSSNVVGDNAWVARANVGNRASGSITIDLSSSTSPGTDYELRMFTVDASGINREATSPSFTVQANPCPTCQVSAAPNPVTAGADLTVSFSGVPSPKTGDFIALYPSVGTADSLYGYYVYTGAVASGKVDLRMSPSLPAGSTYELRLQRYDAAHDTFTRLATSSSFTVRATCSVCTLSEGPDPAIAGGRLAATFSGLTVLTHNAWIGVYPSNLAANSAYVAMGAVGSLQHGTIYIPLPVGATPGADYELRLFAGASSPSAVATSPSFTLETNPCPTCKVSTAPNPVTAGADLTVSFSGVPSPKAGDFIALYPSVSTADSLYGYYVYTGAAASGKVDLRMSPSLPAGSTYELRLERYDSAHGTFTRLATSSSFTMVATPCPFCVLSEGPDPALAGGRLAATWSGIASPHATDWIGVYATNQAADTAYVTRVNTNGTASGSITISIPPGTPPGADYELRLFTNGTYTRLATAPPFTMAAHCGACSLSATPNPVRAGSPLTVTFAGITQPGSADFIGLYSSVGTPHSNDISYASTGGKASGHVQITVPAGTPPGTTYELRFEHYVVGAYTPVVNSASFSVN